MGDWSNWIAGLALFGLLLAFLWLRRLSTRLATVESAAQLASPAGRQKVSVAELLAREDAAERSKAPVGTPSSQPARSAREAEITMPLPRPRQLVVLGPPPKDSEDDPGPWFRPASEPVPNRATRDGRTPLCQTDVRHLV